MRRPSTHSRTKTVAILYLLSAGLMLIQANRPHWTGFVRQAVIFTAEPALALGSTLDETVRACDRFVTSHRALLAENEQLRAENRRLEQVASGYEDVFTENHRLKCLLDLHADTPQRLAARVVGRTGNTWYRNVLLDKGTRDGVVKDAAVVHPEGVVGQVVEVMNDYCRVQLILDEISGVPCVVRGSQKHGILRGSGEQLCRLEFMHHQREDVLEQVLVTSGLGGVYPKGLAVGRITGYENAPWQGAVNIEVRPVVNFDDLEEVMILLHGEQVDEKPTTQALGERRASPIG